MLLPISQIAQQAKTSISQIRYWIKTGKLKPDEWSYETPVSPYKVNLEAVARLKSQIKKLKK